MEPTDTPTAGHDPAPVRGSIQLRVRYVECDPMGVAHHASYLPWLEMARSELLRDAGRSYADMEADGFFLVITRADLRYRRPVRYDDLVEIRVEADLSSRVKITHHYELVLLEHGTSISGCQQQVGQSTGVPLGTVCFAGCTQLGCVGHDGRPRELPEWLRSTRHDRLAGAPTHAAALGVSR